MNFEALVETIAEIHRHTHRAATKAVNVALTCRNCLIGAYIHEYELQGQDRAEYGARLFEQLEKRLGELGVPNCNRSRLYRYRDFYRLYPHIQPVLPVSYSGLLPADIGQPEGKVATPSPQSAAEIVATPSPLSADLILERLSYSHIELLLEMDDPLKRSFYEVECIKGGWSVRELKRQIGSLYFERSGLSRDKEALSRLANADAEAQTPALAIRDPYVFEFLGLRPQEVLPGLAAKTTLLAKLEAFLATRGDIFRRRPQLPGQVLQRVRADKHDVCRCFSRWAFRAKAER